MKFEPFKASVRIQKDYAIIDMHGEINTFAESELNCAYEIANHENPEVIYLNFSQVSYINSTGIALIVGMLAEARKSHQKLSVYGLNDHYLEIFRITRLADFMNIYSDEASALEK